MKDFNMGSVQPFYSGVDETKLANTRLRLRDGKSCSSRQTKHSMAIADLPHKAIEQIEHLPEAGECRHFILKGDFALWDFIPATIILAGSNVDLLTIATLGFSKKNVESLSKLVDSGCIKAASILCSHYFSAQDSEIYEQMVELCGKHNFPIAAMRTHAKILLMLIDGKPLVVESSANLRSSHNCEQATMFNCEELYLFHRQWIGELLEGAQ